MSQDCKKIPVTVAHTEDEWQSVLSFIDAAAKFRRGGWDAWAASFRTLVDAAIQQSKQVETADSSKRASTQPARNDTRRYEPDFFEDEEPATLYEIMGVSEDEYTMDELLDLMD